MEWFQKWSKFHRFNLLTTQPDLSMSPSKGFQEEEDEEVIHPGEITADDLLDLESTFLKDPNPIKEYCNYTMKKGLKEDVHFKIIDH